MDIFADPVLLSRIQFALTASYHFIFVPITIGKPANVSHALAT